MEFPGTPGTPGTNLPWTLGPLEALRRWPIGQRVLMLHSGRPDARWSRYTLLARADGAYRFVTDQAGGGRSEWIGTPESCPVQLDQFKHRPLRDLGQVLADREALWVGYLGYDLGRYIEKLPSLANDDRGWPIVQMQRCPGWLIHDNVTGQWRACGAWRDYENSDAPDLPTLPVNDVRFHADTPKPLIDRAAHERAIARALEYIAAGDIFQVNLTQRFTAQCDGNPRALYDTLARQSPAWYGAYLELENPRNHADPAGQTQPTRRIACNSPELFFSLDGQRNVTTRPIKGTRPASADPHELLNSAKDHAELTMIVDLLRNDLGRVCAYGSVRVPEPRVIESHPTVHHTAATVTGKLHPSKTLIDLLRAVMPGGSITGAPKVRAMQIIDELEPVRRGPYTGAIGYIHGDTACFNIAIRTLLIESGTDDASRGRGHVDYSVGGGIVADSTPAGEYEESLVKAQAMLRALSASQKQQPSHSA
jgi:para-aminobenzoate synthetase component 1